MSVLDVIFRHGYGPPGPGRGRVVEHSTDELGTVVGAKTWGGDGLRGRLAAFHRSATTGAKGHAGGVTYNAIFGPSVDGLYVCTHVPVAIRRDPEILRAYVLYVERRLIWKHVERVGRLPACNSE